MTVLALKQCQSHSLGKCSSSSNNPHTIYFLPS